MCNEQSNALIRELTVQKYTETTLLDSYKVAAGPPSASIWRCSGLDSRTVDLPIIYIVHKYQRIYASSVYRAITLEKHELPELYWPEFLLNQSFSFLSERDAFICISLLRLFSSTVLCTDFSTSGSNYHTYFLESLRTFRSQHFCYLLMDNFSSLDLISNLLN